MFVGPCPHRRDRDFWISFIFCKFCLKLVELAFCLGLFGGRESFDFISIFLSCLHGGKTCILMCGLKCSLGVVWIMRLGLG